MVSISYNNNNNNTKSDENKFNKKGNPHVAVVGHQLGHAI